MTVDLAPSATYYDQPLVKSPVWTWEVPVYFFVGGAAGGAALIAWVVASLGVDPALARDARFIAVAGALIAPGLLISDLGRPQRFLYMLRVFKTQSPMSVGAWTLVAFSMAATAALGMTWLVAATSGGLVVLARSLDTIAAATGLLLATYTGVLIGATAIRVWSRYIRVLPLLFGVSGLGAAVAVLEILGHRTIQLNLVGIGVATVETIIGVMIEFDRDRVALPLRHGVSGHLVRAAAILSGPVSLALRLVGGAIAPIRLTAAGCMIVGSLLTRIGWIHAGRASATDAAVALN